MLDTLSINPQFSSSAALTPAWPAQPAPVPMLIWDVWVLWIFGNWGLGDHSLAQKLYPSICYPYLPIQETLCIWKIVHHTEIGGAGAEAGQVLVNRSEFAMGVLWSQAKVRISHILIFRRITIFQVFVRALSRVWIIQIIWKSFLWTSQTPLQIVFLLSVNVDWEFRPESHKHFNVVKNSIRDRKLI